MDSEGVVIYDLQSSNGTFLNGIKIQESEIQEKDKVSLAQTTFDIVQAQAVPQLYSQPAVLRLILIIRGLLKGL